MVKSKLTLYLIFLVAVFSTGYAQVKRIQVFQKDAEIIPQINIAAAVVDTTLPQPKLHPEPEYTWGLENTVNWNCDSIKTVVAGANAKVVLFEVEALYNNIERWGYVDSWKSSATFDDLPGGVRISYRLRYLADKGNDEYAFSKWSPVEVSIQDVSAPFITRFEIKHLQKNGGINWIIGREIDIQITCSDTALGKVKDIIFKEESEEVNAETKYTVENPVSVVDTTIRYSVYTSDHKQLKLILWVEDLAGQPSLRDTIEIFWWPFEGEEKDVLCFPNPFNPELNERSIIKCNVANATEARIYDLFGNLVRILSKTPDDYFFEWDGRNGQGDVVSNGGYVCVIKNALNKYCKIAVIR